MIKMLRYFLLCTPLLLSALIWLDVFWDVSCIPDGLLKDDTIEYNGDGREPSGLISLIYFYVIYLIVMIVGSLVGSIYTVYKKLWWWFAIYMLLFGFPANIFLYLSFQDDVVAPIILAIIGIPSSFVIGLIYTAYKKLWWWFAASQVIGFGFWIYLHLS